MRFFILAALALTCTLRAADVSLYPGSQTRVSTLSNGLTLIATHDPRHKTGSVMVWVKVGGSQEEEGKSGIAHLFEHMMFRPLKAGEADFSELLKRSATEGGASTFGNATVYYDDLLPAALHEVLGLEGRRFSDRRVDPQLLDIERGAVHSELQQKMGTQLGFALASQLFQAAFPGQGLGHWSPGSISDLDGLTADDCNAFFDRFYVPGNAALLVNGPWDLDKVRTEAEAAFVAWKAAKTPAMIPDTASFKSGDRGSSDFKVAYPHVMIGLRYPGPGLQPGSEDDFLVHLFFYSPWNLTAKRLKVQAGLSPWLQPQGMADDPGLWRLVVAMNPKVRTAEVLEEVAKLPEQLDSLSQAQWDATIKEWHTGYRENCLWPSQMNQRLGQAWSRGGLDVFIAFMSAPPVIDRLAFRRRAAERFDPKNLAAVSCGVSP